MEKDTAVGVAVGVFVNPIIIRGFHVASGAFCIHSAYPIFSSIIGGSIISSSHTLSTLIATMNRSFVSNSKIDYNLSLLLGSTSANLFFHKYVLREEFRNILPSNIVYPGSFAREGINIRSVKVSKIKKLQIQEIGKRNGCHHCGKKSSLYIADHIPPTKIYRELAGVKGSNLYKSTLIRVLYRLPLSSDHVNKHNQPYLQQLYPQCQRCCGKQAGFVSHHNFLTSFSKKAIVVHRPAFRFYYIFLPSYFLLEVLHNHLLRKNRN